MPDKKTARQIIKVLKKSYPIAECALYHHTAFQLLTATILSAQCTDERVNSTTPTLFSAYPDASSLAVAKQTDVEQIIKPLGFFRAKAANIIGMAQQLVFNHSGEVPDRLEELIKLPGVGRKTANVVLGTWFGQASGVVVDTHVKRISKLLGLTDNSTPEKIELDLMSLLPESEWIMYSHRIIHHGRKICIARRPRCEACPLLKLCPRNGIAT